MRFLSLAAVVSLCVACGGTPLPAPNFHEAGVEARIDDEGDINVDVDVLIDWLEIPALLLFGLDTGEAHIRVCYQAVHEISEGSGGTEVDVGDEDPLCALVPVRRWREVAGDADGSGETPIGPPIPAPAPEAVPADTPE